MFARKLIRPFSTIAIEDVENEVRALTKLCVKGHLNIVQVRSHDWLSGSPYYAIDMEYCELTLAEYIQEKRNPANDRRANSYEKVLKWRDICKIMINIISGVAFIHNCNEIHRDLKPSNGVFASCTTLTIVLYSKYTNSWKIADFGFIAEGSSKNIIVSTMSKGTTSYRAPELIKEQPLFTRKVDIWAIGCIFYELVTREKAFLSDRKVREYGMSKRALDISNVDYHFGASHRFFAFRLRETLKRDWSRRPSARELLGSFQNFDVYLLYFERQASLVKTIDSDVDVNSAFELAPEPSANISNVIEVEESKGDKLILDNMDEHIHAVDQETEVHMPTRKRRKGNNMYGSKGYLKCQICKMLKRKVLCWLS